MLANKNELVPVLYIRTAEILNAPRTQHRQQKENAETLYRVQIGAPLIALGVNNSNQNRDNSLQLHQKPGLIPCLIIIDETIH